jgi:hypothetical protein
MGGYIRATMTANYVRVLLFEAAIIAALILAGSVFS